MSFISWIQGSRGEVQVPVRQHHKEIWMIPPRIIEIFVCTLEEVWPPNFWREKEGIFDLMKASEETAGALLLSSVIRPTGFGSL